VADPDYFGIENGRVKRRVWERGHASCPENYLIFYAKMTHFLCKIFTLFKMHSLNRERGRTSPNPPNPLLLWDYPFVNTILSLLLKRDTDVLLTKFLIY